VTAAQGDPPADRRSVPAVATRASVRAAYDAIAASYADARREPWPEVVAFIESLPGRTRILDLGCGHGRHLAPLASCGRRATGLDASRELLAIGRDRASSAGPGVRSDWVQGDAVGLPFRDAVFDACIAIAVLHHLPSDADRLAAVREVHRVLGPGGRACLGVWDFEGPRFDAIREDRLDLPPEVRGDVEMPWPLPDGRAVPRYYHLFQEGELEALIIEAGLHGETFFRASGNRYALARRHG
jgi:SAM-dependent methyltransferase